MRNFSFAIIFIMSPLVAYAIQDCENEKILTRSDSEENPVQIQLSKIDAEGLANAELGSKKIIVPDQWCRTIAVETRNDKVIWRVSFSGNNRKLDECFWVEIDDVSKESAFFYCG